MLGLELGDDLGFWWERGGAGWAESGAGLGPEVGGFLVEHVMHVLAKPLMAALIPNILHYSSQESG